MSKFSTGHIVNLVSNDAQRMEALISGVIKCILFPYSIVFGTLLLSLLIGWRSLSGVLLLFLLVAFFLFLTNIFGHIRQRQAKATDERLAVMSEIIAGIKAVKTYAWEWKYKDVVEKLRR